MKTLYLIGSRLRQYILKSKLLFILFILGGILNGIGMSYCYGNLLPLVAERDSDNAKYRGYFIAYQELGSGGSGWQPAIESVGLETVEKLKNHPLIESCIFTNDSDYVCAYDENYPKLMLSGTDQFTGPYQTLVYEKHEANVGDIINLRGHEYEVIGKCSFGFPGCLIPYDTYVSLGYGESTFRMSAVAKERYSARYPAQDPILKLLEELFPGSYRQKENAATEEQQEIETFIVELPGIVLNAFMTMLAYVFLLRYLIDSLLDETIVSIIVGASRLRMTVYIFWEAFLLSVSANGLGLLVHWLLYKPLFQKLNLAAELVYHASDYLLLLGGIVAFSLVITIPFALKYLRLSPIAARREHA